MKNWQRRLPFFWAVVIGLLPSRILAQIPEANLELTDGSKRVVKQLTLSDSGEIRGSGLESPIKLFQLLSIQTPLPTPQPAASPVVLYLEGGSQLPADSLLLDKEKLTAQLAEGMDGSGIQLETIRGVAFRDFQGINKFLNDRATDQDIVIVDTGNGPREVRGLLEGITSAHVLLNYKNKSRKIGLDKVAGLVTADLEIPKQTGIQATATLTDGSRVVGVLKQLNAKATFELPGQSSFAFPSKKIVAIQFDSDALVYLSQREPDEVEIRPQFAPKRNWTRNQSILGNPLTLFDKQRRPVQFSRGIGTMSYSRLLFKNTGDFDQLKATVGIDAETKGQGDCVMSILGDGQKLWSQRVQGKDAFREILVPLQGVSQIELVVEQGEEFDLADHANWCDIRLLKVD